MYELFASVYCGLHDLTKDLYGDHALDIHGCSAVEKYETDDKDIAVKRFQASNSYISFCERFWGSKYSSMDSTETILCSELIRSREKTRKRFFLFWCYLYAAHWNYPNRKDVPQKPCWIFVPNNLLRIIIQRKRIV